MTIDEAILEISYYINHHTDISIPSDTALRMAISALRAKQEAEDNETFWFTVIDTKTGEYPDLQKIALREEWAKGLCYCDMDGFSINEDGTLILMDECGRFAYPPVGRFKIVRVVDDE